LHIPFLKKCILFGMICRIYTTVACSDWPAANQQLITNWPKGYDNEKRFTRKRLPSGYF
jgi:hypothetical protein